VKKKKAVKICRTCGEMIWREKAGLWPGCDYVRETPGRVLLCFLYLRVELAHNCKKVRSPIYNPPSLFDIPFFSILKSPFPPSETEPVSPHNNFTAHAESHLRSSSRPFFPARGIAVVVGIESLRGPRLSCLPWMSESRRMKSVFGNPECSCFVGCLKLFDVVALEM